MPKQSVPGALTVLVAACLLFVGPGPRTSHAQPPAAPPAAQPPTTPQTPQMPQTRPGMPSPSMPVRDPRLAAAPTGTAVIKGRIVAMETGAPLRRAQVRVFGQPMRMPRGTLTDAQGQYEIKDLPAGRFTVTAMKGGYVMLEYGQRRPLEPGRPIELADGQTMDKIDIGLPRGGVITGRVVDELGEPVINTMVSAMMYRRMGGRRRLMPASGGPGGMTNDIGVFRIFGLPPGDYYVAAGANSGMFSGMDASMDTPTGLGYAPTYYPGTASVAEAQKLTVNIGEEVNVDLQLIPTRVSKVMGTVVDSQGRPSTLGFVMLQARSDDVFMMGGAGGAPLREGGAFTLNNVAPGSYYVVVNSMMTNPSSPETREFAMLPITVAGQDIDNVRLVMSRGGSIQGRVAYDGGTPPASAGQLRLSCTPTEMSTGPMMMGGGNQGMSDDQGGFEIKGVFMPCQIRAFMGSPGWTMKSVVQDGQDITDRTLNVAAGKAVSGVVVTMTNRQTTLTGTVTDGQGRPLKEYAVVVFADDPEKVAQPMSRYIGRGRPDQQGTFKVTSLPPGEYLAVAIESIEQGAESDPEFLERVRPLATRTRLSEDAPQSITLKLSSPPAQ